MTDHGLRDARWMLTPVLLGCRLALECRELGFHDRTYPVMIGDRVSNELYGPYFTGGCHPNLSALQNVVVESVEKKMREHLGRQGLGSPLLPPMSVKAIVDAITSNQGGFVEGQAGEYY